MPCDRPLDSSPARARRLSARVRRALSAVPLLAAAGAAIALSPVAPPPPPPPMKEVPVVPPIVRPPEPRPLPPPPTLPPVKPPPREPAPRWIAFRAPEATTPIRLRQVDVQARLGGSTAVTRVELTVFNPNARVLSGELQFPLNAGQAVTGFALDINGVLRRAVPVEKAKGRQVYEDTVRAGVDPALLEVTEGNFYKLQVYPLPAGGTRRVVLEIRESIEAAAAGAAPVWRLPLQFSGVVEQLAVDLRVDGLSPSQLSASWGAEPLTPSATPEGTRLSLRRDAAAAAGELRVELPARLPAPVVSTERFKGKTYLLAEVPVDIAPWPRTAPRTVGLVWDASSSGATRDHDREFALLDEWLRRLGQVELRLKVVRNDAEAVERFAIRDGDWRALRRRLEQLPYDGATALGAMTAPEGVDLTLLFSDGVGTWGTGSLPTVGKPLFSFSASAGAAESALRRAAEATGGAYVDLLSTSTEEALRQLAEEQPRLLDVTGVGAGEWEMNSVHPQGGRLLIAGVMAQAQARMKLTVSTANGSPRVIDVPLRAGAPATEAGASVAPTSRDLEPVGLAAYRWASFRLARLDADRGIQRQAVRRLGMDFGLVTRETSLIVLDTVGDYVRHEIEPPAELRREWDSLVAQRTSLRQRQRAEARTDLIERFEALVKWWNETPATRAAAARREQLEAKKAALAEALRAPPVTPPPERSMPVPTPAPAEPQKQVPAPMATPSPSPSPAPMPAPTVAAPAPARDPNDGVRRPIVAAPAMDAAQMERLREVEAQSRQRSSSSASPAAAAAAAAAAARGDRSSTGAPGDIALRPWRADEPYARRLRAAADKDLYAIYLDERPSYANSSAFFLDVADRLVERKRIDLAVRVLSNLAEMDLGNRQLLRILAYRLKQAGRSREAIPVLEEVLRLAPDEPQSYRDLGLTFAEAGEPQRAVDLLAEVVNRPWQNRFADIELIALEELNAIAERSRAKGKPLDLSAIDERLRRPLPLALRVVLSWDADNTDIDLWVDDPDGERAFFLNPNTRQGGRMSRDFTGGYGPEQFELRFAKPGTYTVRANFFGHRQQVIAPSTTLMLRLSTGFATPRQQDKDIVLRLSGTGSEVVVGTITIK
ncbi:VIT domain-containing protein [Roseateles chitosanitabidus]|uniref:VIT domain-containing protein n=1 Tax=Roseateles chitosanitabidus TaxID=65048 RepID=UPI0008314247|nr:VIT domain-containing protein [Roseateles chitosanitabidus]